MLTFISGTAPIAARHKFADKQESFIVHEEKLDKILEVMADVKDELSDVKAQVAGLKGETRAQTKIIGATRIAVKEVRTEQKAHDDKDEKRFGERDKSHGEQGNKIRELETSMKWVKGIGSFIVTMVGAILYSVFGWKVK